MVYAWTMQGISQIPSIIHASMHGLYMDNAVHSPCIDAWIMLGICKLPWIIHAQCKHFTSACSMHLSCIFCASVFCKRCSVNYYFSHSENADGATGQSLLLFLSFILLSRPQSFLFWKCWWCQWTLFVSIIYQSLSITILLILDVLMVPRNNFPLLSIVFTLLYQLLSLAF